MALPAIHPGEHLAEELQALDMSAAALARKIDVPTNRVTQILNGTRSVTGDTALRLAHFFGTSPQFWLNLQSLYDLRLAKEKAGQSIKALPTLKRRELTHASSQTPCSHPANDFPGLLRPWTISVHGLGGLECGIEIIDLGTRGSERLRDSLVSQLAEQKVNFSPNQNGKTGKIKPHV
jgi:antitoxin HigA-1